MPLRNGFERQILPVMGFLSGRFCRSSTKLERQILPLMTTEVFHDFEGIIASFVSSHAGEVALFEKGFQDRLSDPKGPIK